MKRLWSTPEFVTGQKVRARKRDRRRRAVRRPRSTRTERQIGIRRGEKELLAPRKLDLFDEPDDTIKYCNQLRQALTRQGTTVFMDLSAVEEFTSDSLLVLRAIMDGRRAPGTYVRGNLPFDPVVASEFKASGFFEGFSKPPANLPPPKGLMKKASDHTVYARVAAELVGFASQRAKVTLTRECRNASSNSLIELMTNTHNHAGYGQYGNGTEKPRQEQWWASVYCQDDVAYFSFVDLGVGILESAPKNLLRMLKNNVLVSLAGRSRLLTAAFTEGRVGPATGERGRGFGLRRMRKDAMEARLTKLKVLTSDVAGSVAGLNFRSTSHSLRGTVFRWRIGGEREES